LLDASSHVSATESAPQVRGWRDDLAHLAALLAYARDVLTVDLGILRSLNGGNGDLDAVVEGLPHLLAATVDAEPSPAADELTTVALEDPAVMEGEAQGLLEVHRALGTVDLGSSEAVGDLIEDVETQLGQVADRRALVESRLRDLQAVLLEQYRSGAATADDWLR
jgi:hypothetical protein